MVSNNIFYKILMFFRRLLITDRGISIDGEIKTGKPELDKIVSEYVESTQTK